MLYQLSYFRTSLCTSCRKRLRALFFAWAVMDSNHRRRKPADLQSAPFGHSGNCPFCGLRVQKYGFFLNQQTFSRLFYKKKRIFPPFSPFLQRPHYYIYARARALPIFLAAPKEDKGEQIQGGGVPRIKRGDTGHNNEDCTFWMQPSLIMQEERFLLVAAPTPDALTFREDLALFINVVIGILTIGVNYGQLAAATEAAYFHAQVNRACQWEKICLFHYCSFLYYTIFPSLAPLPKEGVEDFI